MSDHPNCIEACRAPVVCVTCRRTKAPRGRSVPLEMSTSMCDPDCAGYYTTPRAPHLWPNESIGDETDDRIE